MTTTSVPEWGDDDESRLTRFLVALLDERRRCGESPGPRLDGERLARSGGADESGDSSSSTMARTSTADSVARRSVERPYSPVFAGARTSLSSSAESVKLVSLLLRDPTLGRQSEKRLLSGDDDIVKLGEATAVGCALRLRTSCPRKSMSRGTGAGWSPTVAERTRGGGAPGWSSSDVRVGGRMSDVEVAPRPAQGGSEGSGRVGAGGAGGEVDMGGKGKAASSSGMVPGAGVGLVSLKSASARLAARTASSSGGEREVERLTTSKSAGATGDGTGDGRGDGIAGTDQAALGERARLDGRCPAADESCSSVDRSTGVTDVSAKRLVESRSGDDAVNGRIEEGDSGTKLDWSPWSAAHRTIGLCGERGASLEDPACASSHASHSPFSSLGVASSGELMAKSCDRSRYSRMKPSPSSPAPGLATTGGCLDEDTLWVRLAADDDRRRAEAMRDERADLLRLSGGAGLDDGGERAPLPSLGLPNEKRRPRWSSGMFSLTLRPVPRRGKCAMRERNDEGGVAAGASTAREWCRMLPGGWESE